MTSAYIQVSGVGSACLSCVFCTLTIFLLYWYFRKRTWRIKLISLDRNSKTNARVLKKYTDNYNSEGKWVASNGVKTKSWCKYTFDGIRENWNGTKDNIRVIARSRVLPPKLDKAIKDDSEAEVWYLPEEPRVCMLKGESTTQSIGSFGSFEFTFFAVQFTVLGTLYFLVQAYGTSIGYAIMGTMLNCTVLLCFCLWYKMGRKCSKCWWKLVFPDSTIRIIDPNEEPEAIEIEVIDPMEAEAQPGRSKAKPGEKEVNKEGLAIVGACMACCCCAAVND